MSDVSIIIVNFNAGHRLTDCVTSILEAPDRAEIIVVDNRSDDDSLERLLAAHGRRKRLQIIRNPANLGFARACNIGARQATGEYLFYLNPDCLIQTHTLTTLTTALARNPEAGMVGGRLLNPDGTEQPGSRRDIPDPWRAFVHLAGLYRFVKAQPALFSDFSRHREAVPESEITVEAVSGACMMVPRTVVAATGGFDEAYFLHVEDLDWCLRIRQQGWKILFVPGARVIHAKGGCSHRRPIRVEWHKHLGLTRFYWKFFRRRHGGLWMPVAMAGVWGHFLLTALSLLWKKAWAAVGRRPEGERS